MSTTVPRKFAKIHTPDTLDVYNRHGCSYAEWPLEGTGDTRLINSCMKTSISRQGRSSKRCGPPVSTSK